MARLLTLLFAAIVVGNAAADVGFDYLLFAQEWPPTFCDKQDCNFPDGAIKGWNIHGLWPSVNHGRDPMYCHNGRPFDSQAIKPILRRLQSGWADLKDYDSPTEFWGYEWKKHGRCALGDPLLGSELKYFNASLMIKNKLSLDKVLASNNIVPNDREPYDIDTIMSAMQRAYGVTPKLECSNGDGDYSNWMSTRFCVDQQLRPIQCHEDRHRAPLSKSSRKLETSPCGDKVLYPTFSSIRYKKLYRPLIQWMRGQFGDRM